MHPGWHALSCFPAAASSPFLLHVCPHACIFLRPRKYKLAFTHTPARTHSERSPEGGGKSRKDLRTRQWESKFWDVAPQGYEHLTPMQYKEMLSAWLCLCFLLPF